MGQEFLVFIYGKIKKRGMVKPWRTSTCSSEAQSGWEWEGAPTWDPDGGLGPTPPPALFPGGSEGSGMACIRVAQKSCAPERGEGEGESGEDQVARGGAGECGKPAPWLLFSEETSPLLLPVGGF